MTHTRQLDDSEGVFGAATATEVACPKCHAQRVSFEVWESNDGAFEDVKYTCAGCGHVWWMDGIDS